MEENGNFKSLRETFKHSPNLSGLERISLALAPYENMLKSTGRLSAMIGSPLNAISKLYNLHKVWEPYERIFKIGLNVYKIGNLAILANPFPELTRFAKYAGSINKCQSSDWMPHKTTPFEAFSSPSIEIDETQKIIESFYRENWQEIKLELATRFDGYGLDEIGTQEIKQALELHENGYYRSVPLSIFPSLESLARKHLEQKDIATVTSMKSAREAVYGKYVSDLNEFDHGMFLFQTFDEHVFENLNDIKKLEKFKKTDIPNRHAALHGYIAYNSFRASMNTLILADFTLFMINMIVNSEANED